MLDGQRRALANLLGDLFTLAHKLAHGDEVVNQSRDDRLLPRKYGRRYTVAPGPGPEE